VAWVAERKDVLSTFFWMLATAAYIHYVDRPRLKNYLLVILLFSLGLMAKPMLVTLPFVLLLLDYWPLQRLQEAGSRKQEARSENQNPGPDLKPLSSNKRKTISGKRNTIQKSSQSSVARTIASNCTTESASAGPEVIKPPSSVLHLPLSAVLLEKIPLFALAALSCIVTYLVQQKAGAVKSIEVFPSGVRIANALVSYMIYIEKTIWPTNLAVFYPHPGLRPLWQVFGSALALIAVTIIVIRSAKSHPYLALGWLWFLGTLVPVIGIVQVGAQAMADHYTYIPLIGLFIMAAWGVPELVKKWRYHKAALFGSSVLVLTCLFIITWTQLEYWKDGISLYDHALKVTSHNDIIFNCRGDAYCRLGNLERAIEDFDMAVRINPGNVEAYYNRGVTYGKLGNHRRAIQDFDRAIEIEPGSAEPYYNRGFAYSELGDYREAIENYNKVIEIRPENADAYISRGVAYGNLGDQGRAISDYDRAIEIDPGQARAFNNRGFAYGRLGNYGQAVLDFDRAIELDPRYAKALYNRAFACAELGRDTQAIEDLKTAAGLGSEDAKNLLRSQGISW
jgi:tetratricopeptide (TPR) repeat protein